MMQSTAFDTMPTTDNDPNSKGGFERASETTLKSSSDKKKKKRKSSKKNRNEDSERHSSVETASTHASTLESDERRKQKKSKKKSKKSSKKDGRSGSSSLELPGASFGLEETGGDDDGFFQQQRQEPPPSIIEDEELMMFDRKPSPAEKAQAESKGAAHEDGNASINSTDSSIFSSYPQDQKPSDEPQQQTSSYDYNRGSLLDDADSCVGGMRGKSDDCSVATWNLAPSKHATLEAFNSNDKEEKSAPTAPPLMLQVPARRKNSTTNRQKNKQPTKKQPKRSEATRVEQPNQSSLWSPFVQQQQQDAFSTRSDSIVGSVVSARTKSSGESTPMAANNQQGNPPIPDAISQKAMEAQRLPSSAPRLPRRSRNRPGSERVPPQMSSNANIVPPSDASVGSQASSMTQDMLVRYLRSMGTSRRTAVNIASSFREDQQQNEAPASVDGVPPVVPEGVPDAPPTSRRSRSRSSLRRGSNGSSANRTSRSSSSRGGGRRRGRSAMMWERAMRPGAVQMDGRAFGAPMRPEDEVLDPAAREESAPSQTEVVGAHLVEATAVKDYAPVVYADSTPLSFRDLLKEKPIRRRMCILGFIVVAVVAISVSLVVVNGDDGSESANIVVAGSTSEPTMAPSSAPTFITAEIFDAAVALSGEDVVNNPDSPQHQAVGWISTFDTLTDGFGEMFEQRYTMATLFYSLGGRDWLELDNWLSPVEHECDWSDAVFCKIDGTGRRLVNGLDLTRNGLLGSLPDELYLTTHLEFLRLSKNRIQGSLPSALFNLPSLAVLDINSNEVVGKFPETVGNEDDLVFMDVSYNMLTGKYYCFAGSLSPSSFSLCLFDFPL